MAALDNAVTASKFRKALEGIRDALWPAQIDRSLL
jgi:hypothetical protein